VRRKEKGVKIVMKVKVKRLTDSASIPTYANETDAGLDFIADSMLVTPDYIEYGTGLSMEIPEGYVGLLFPRSSISKLDMSLCNSVGVVDSGYRGEIKFRFNYKEVGNLGKRYHTSDKIGQMIILPYPKVVLEMVEELDESERSTNGFGSTGN
jgi:dUTP pyrophosphatase